MRMTQTTTLGWEIKLLQYQLLAQFCSFVPHTKYSKLIFTSCWVWWEGGIGRNNRRGERGSQILEETLMERDERMGD